MTPPDRRQPEALGRADRRDLEPTPTPALSGEKLKKVKQNLWGFANDATDKIRKLAGRNIDGAAEKIGSIVTYIVDQAATINGKIVEMALSKLNATSDPVEQAKIIEAFKKMLGRRVEAAGATFATGPATTYEDMARAADFYRASTEIAKNEKLTDIYKSVCRGTPLSAEELIYLVSLCDSDKIKDQAGKEGSGDTARTYLQMGLGAVIGRMRFEQKVPFAAAYIKAKGFETYNQLADIMMFSGSLKPNDYKELLSQLGNKDLSPAEKTKVQQQLAKFNDPKYLQETTEMAKAGEEAYKKAAEDMKRDYDVNGFQRSMTGKNLGMVVGSLWLGTVALFNGLAAYTAGKTWGERITNAGKNMYFMGSVAGLTAIATEGSVKTAAEKFSPENRPGKRARLKEDSTLALLDTNDKKPSFAGWLKEGGMGLMLTYQKFIKGGALKKQGLDLNSPEGQRRLYASGPSLVDAGKLVDFLQSDLTKDLPNRVALEAGLRSMSKDPNYEDNLNKMLNDSLKTALNAGIYSQNDYAALLDDYRKNRTKYRQFS